MNWRRWKMGLLVALLSGLFTGLAGVVIGTTWKQTLFFVAIAVAKDGQLFLAKHPVESIEDTTVSDKSGKTL